MNKNDERILEAKKQIFTEAVEIACAAANLPMPKINFGYCSEESGYQLAHMHPDTKTICVSKKQLWALDNDIEKVATHEVAHLLVENHSIDFELVLNKIRELSRIRKLGAHIIDGAGPARAFQQKRSPKKA